MDQLSLPYRIALVGLLVVGALYLVVLRPRDPVAPRPAAATPAVTAPGIKGLTRAVDKARAASATQSRSDAATRSAADAASGTTAATPAATSVTPAGAFGPARPASPAAVTDPSAPILAELDRGHTAVVLFAGPRASDDRAVRRAVRAVARRGGRVDVHVVSIRRVGAYEAITRGVTVLQAPTVLVIGRRRTARSIVGFTTTAEIDQLVADVRRG